MANPEVPAYVINIARALRGLALLAILGATVAMATSHHLPPAANHSSSNYLTNIDYRDVTFYKAFLGVNIAATVYSFLAVLLPPRSMLWRLIIVLDVIVFALLVSIDSVAITAAYLQKNGDSQAFWPPICPYVPAYCTRIMGAVATGFIGVAIYLLIIMYSISVILNPFLV